VELFGFPYLEVSFDPAGAVHSTSERASILRFAGDTNCTDLLVLAHGWNGDDADARRLYHALAARCADATGRVEAMQGRRLALLGVLWPARTFIDDSFGGYRPAAPKLPRPDDSLIARLALLGPLVGDLALTTGLAEARTALSCLDRVGGARRVYVDAIRGALGGVRRRLGGSEEVPRAFFSADGAEVFDRLARPPQRVPALSGRAALADRQHPGTAAGPALLGGAWHAARNLLDLAAYLFMRDRASTVGRDGLAPLLRDIQAAGDLRLHLAGHSLGAPLVAAACTDPTRLAPVTSLTLLQGAQSDVGFAAEWAPGRAGAFRPCLAAGALAGPILVTHTANDRVLAAIYAMAQCLAGEPAGTSVGGRCGALGRDGARSTAEAVDGELRKRDGSYQLRPGIIHNLRADAFVSQHVEVAGPEVANALLSAVSWVPD
jgi:hypothetical protein